MRQKGQNMRKIIGKMNKKQGADLCKRTKSKKIFFSFDFSLIPTQKNGIILDDSTNPWECVA